MNIINLMPKDTPEYMTDAWLSCISWATGDKATIDRFVLETGEKYKPGSTPLEQIIDKATGAEQAVVARFIEWVNENLWGAME